MRKSVAFLDKYILNRWRQGIHEKLFASYLPEDPVIVEGGAHIGTDSTAMAKTWRRGTIHAFEPVPEIYEKLVLNTRQYPNIITYPYALGMVSGHQKMYISSGESDASSSLLKPKEHLQFFPGVHFKTDKVVETVALDDWSFKYQVPKVDLMWLDLQGFEMEAMKGGMSLLPLVSCIYLEVNTAENYSGCPLFDQIYDWLSSNGFRLQSFIAESECYGNAIFIKNKPLEDAS